MNMNLLLCAVVTAAFVGVSATQFEFSGTTPTILAEFHQVDYDFSDLPPGTRAAMIANGSFVPVNNIIAGVHAHAATGNVFLTVPRWRPGVPSTLNILVPSNAAGSPPLLRPWPSWAAQTNLFGYVQSVFVDNVNHEVWVIDAGRQNIFGGVPSQIINTSAKLYILNAFTGALVQSVVFPNNILPYDSSFLNDIEVDVPKQVAYMTDTNTAGLGAIVFWNRQTGFTYRFEDPNSTYAIAADSPVVNFQAYPLINNPVDGIALHGNGDTLYYSSVRGFIIFSVPTNLLQYGASNSVIRASVQSVWMKNTISDGMAWLPTGDPTGSGGLLYGGMANDTLLLLPLTASKVPATSGPLSLYSSINASQWMDTLKYVAINQSSTTGVMPTAASWIANQYQSVGGFDLYYTTNRLQNYFFDATGWVNGPDAKLRVFKWSYVTVGPTTLPPVVQDYTLAHILLPLGIVGLVICMIVLCACIVKMNTQESTRRQRMLDEMPGA